MENNSIKVFGYIRVSTEGQVKQGYSLGEQQAEIEKYCGCHGYELAGIFRDEGISGAKASKRQVIIDPPFSSLITNIFNRRPASKIIYTSYLDTTLFTRLDFRKFICV